MLRLCGFSFVCLGLCFFGVSGCSKKAASSGTDVSGKVSYNQKPVTGGSIQLYPKQGGGAYPGTINPDGSFSFKGLAISGEVIVTVDTEALRKFAEAKQKGADPAIMKKMMESMQGGGVYVPIPPKYSDRTTSPLTETIKAGTENRFDLVLKD